MAWRGMMRGERERNGVCVTRCHRMMRNGYLRERGITCTGRNNETSWLSRDQTLEVTLCYWTVANLLLIQLHASAMLKVSTNGVFILAQPHLSSTPQPSSAFHAQRKISWCMSIHKPGLL